MISLAAAVVGQTPTTATATSPQARGRIAGLRAKSRLLMIVRPAEGVKVFVIRFIDAIVFIVRRMTESLAHSPPLRPAGAVRGDRVNCAADRALRDRPRA